MEPLEAAELVREMKRALEDDLRARITLFYRQTGLQVEGVDLLYMTAMGKQDELIQISTRLKI